MKPLRLAEPTLVGRSNELDQLRVNLELMKHGKGSTILIAGEAGSGKTRLAQEFLHVAEEQNVIVLYGWCLSNAATPYFPFIEALESYTENANSNLASSSKLLGIENRLNGTSRMGNISTIGLTPQTWKDQTYSLVTRELVGISSSRPLILFLDDLHWADSASLSLLHYLSRSIISERILILATYRTEEVECSSDGQPNQLKNALHLMARENIFSEIRLECLDQGGITELVEVMLEGKAHESLIEKMTRDSQGLPLFVVESIRALSDRNQITKEDGLWKLSVQDLAVPEEVKDIIHRRIDQLKPYQRRILEIAAVSGEKLDPMLISKVVEQDRIDVIESLDHLSKSTLLVHCDGENYWFNHAKYREMLYQEIPTLLKKEYHRRIAQKTEETVKGTDQLPVNDLAYHYSRSGDKEKSIKYNLLAGHLALERFSNNEALQFFTTALDLGAANPATKIIATQGLGEAHFANGAFGEALKIFESLGDSSQGAAKLKAYRRAMDSAFFNGEFSKLLKLTEKAQEFSAYDRLENARVLMNKARAIMFLGNQREGSLDFEEALRVFEEENSMPDIARVLLGLGGGGKPKWKIERGLANALRAILYFRELGDLRGLADAYNRAGQSFAYRLFFDEALKMDQNSVELAEKIGHYNRVAEACASLSLMYEVTSRINEALNANKKALEFANKAGSQWVLAIVYSNFVNLYSTLDNLELAEYYYSLLTKLPSEVLANTFVRIESSEISLLIAKKQYGKAEDFLKKALSKMIGDVNPTQAVIAHRKYALVLDKQGKLAEAKEQMGRANQLAGQLRGAFENSNLYAFFLAPKKVDIGKEFRVRLDLINVSMKEATVSKIQGLIPKGLNMLRMPELCNIDDDYIVYQKKLQPFAATTITIDFQAQKVGLFAFSPQIYYLDDIKKGKEVDLPQYLLCANVLSSDAEMNLQITIEFRSQASRSAFDYLIRSFVEDSTRRKIPLESAGWRTLMDVAKNTLVTKYSLYECPSSKRRPLSELEQLHLVESKFFTGQRGRGGRVMKVRVAYENKAVRAHLSLA